MKMSLSESMSALIGAIIGATPFVANWWLYGRTGNPYNTDSWVMGIPAIALAPVAALFGAIVGLLMRADIRKLVINLRSKTESDERSEDMK